MFAFLSWNVQRKYCFVTFFPATDDARTTDGSTRPRSPRNATISESKSMESTTKRSTSDAKRTTRQWTTTATNGKYQSSVKKSASSYILRQFHYKMLPCLVSTGWHAPTRSTWRLESSTRKYASRWFSRYGPTFISQFDFQFNRILESFIDVVYTHFTFPHAAYMRRGIYGAFHSLIISFIVQKWMQIHWN